MEAGREEEANRSEEVGKEESREKIREVREEAEKWMTENSESEETV